MSNPARKEDRVPATTVERPAAVEELAKELQPTIDPFNEVGRPLDPSHEVEPPSEPLDKEAGVVDLTADRAPEVTPMVLRRRTTRGDPTAPTAATAPVGGSPALGGRAAPTMLAGQVTSTIVPGGPLTTDSAAPPETSAPAARSPGSTAVYERVLSEHLTTAIEAAIKRVLPAALEAANLAAQQAPPVAPTVEPSSAASDRSSAKVIDPSSGSV